MMKFFLMIMFVCIITSVNAQSEQQLLKFTVMVLDVEDEGRAIFEDQLVSRLLEENYFAVASHTIIPTVMGEDLSDLSRSLLDEDIIGALILRPLDIGGNASIETIQQSFSAGAYGSVEAFVEGYRGNEFGTQAVVHLAGYVLDDSQSEPFWQGVLWLDDTVSDIEKGRDKLTELVIFNLNQSRSLLRRRYGLAPLSD